ncbi:MAG: Uma2 family endonuclease [Defluviitaleaceae bacterium]|nr:Uma2 family endonuclease [Defluviitaleaceae bacterium]
MAMVAEKLEYYTYGDYLKFDDDIRCELINGVIYNMASPSTTHQRIAGEIWALLREFLKGRRCEAFIAPLDVRLNADKNDDTVVQPDLMVLCDKNKLDPKDRGIIGAPDMVVEVLSPSSGYVDRVLKMKKYQEAGVKEYWIVDPDRSTVDVNILENNKYYVRSYGNSDLVPVQTLPGLDINLGEVFLLDDFHGE